MGDKEDSKKNLATLLVTCPDRKGLVSALAQTLHGHGANILESVQHVDRHAQRFFQRILFDLTELHTDRLTLERGLGEVTERFEMSTRLVYANKRKRLALFVSKQEHCLYELLLRTRSGELNGDIAIIISNHEDLRPVAEQFGIRYEVFSITAENKSEVEERERTLLEELDVDLVVLTRYMQILSKEFLSAYSGAVINIHHSFLPAFIGGKPYHQAHRRGVKLIGATAHYVTSDLDEGPIIEQDVIRTSHADSVGDLIRKGRHVEKQVLAQAVTWQLEDRILVYDNRTVVLK
ncbi:MAG: formyltetrahydrofolate deformylase [Deltaproteobacteria bacterium]|nr:formyltetrahydrofolate deformylase [Deltaproteobacteria bacterium]